MSLHNLLPLLFLLAVRLASAAQPEVIQFSSSDLGLDGAYANATARFRWTAPDTYVSYFLMGKRTTAENDREIILYANGHLRLVRCAIWNVATQLKHNAAVVIFENKTPNFASSTTNPINARIVFFTVPNVPQEANVKTPETMTGIFDFTASDYSKDGAMAKLCDLTNPL